jgi:predicted nucleotidyltransferase component of viral defense system
MISEAAVKRLARAQSVDPVVIDRDHALGVVMWALSTAVPDGAWGFKGGTCLRKCDYPDDRFSEDLDFTVVGSLRAREAEGLIARAAAASASLGVRLLLEGLRTEVMDDEYGRESIEVRIPYRGALRMGSMPNIQFHLSADEALAFAPNSRQLIHPYDDALGLLVSTSSYALEEVLAEKMRAVSGQRRHPIARDVYDIAQLLRRGDADVDAALAALPGKAKRKNVDVRGARERFIEREAEYRVNWSQQLAYLVTDGMEFAAAFDAVAELLGRIEE